jgi:hypothetical protein
VSVSPTREDPVVRGLSEVVGGPMGSRAGRGWRFGALGVLLALTCLTFALGMVSKTTCAERGWDDPGQTPYTHLCVSQLPAPYTGDGLVELAWPWSGETDTRARYGVLDDPAGVGLWQYAAARITHVLTGSPDVSERFREPPGVVADRADVGRERSVFVAVNVVGLAVLALLATAALAAVHRRRPWDAAGFAAAPVLATAGVLSWDLLPVAAAAGALWAWTRGRPVVAGALVGLGAATGLWPVLLLAAFALVAARDRRAADALPAAVTALAVWAVVNAPAFLTGRAQWEVYWSRTFDRVADQGSLWLVLRQTVGISDSNVTTLSWALVGLWLAAVAALVVAAPRRPRVSQVAFLLVAVPLLFGAAYQPQQALWLLPFAALARPRWRDLLIWQAGEVLHFALLWWWLGGLLAPGGGGDAGFYWIGVGLRLAGTLWLVGVVVRDVWWPEHDPVDPDEETPRRRVAPAQSRTTSSNDVAV